MAFFSVFFIPFVFRFITPFRLYDGFVRIEDLYLEFVFATLAWALRMMTWQ